MARFASVLVGFRLFSLPKLKLNGPKTVGFYRSVLSMS